MPSKIFSGKSGSNYLQDRYNEFRLEGGDHGIYAGWNDMSDTLASELKREFEKAHPEGVPKEKTDAWLKRFRSGQQV